MKIIDLTNKRFGRLVVKHRSIKNKYGVPAWDCVCDCGNEVSVVGSSLRGGLTQSCGCKQIDAAKKSNTIHGKKNHPLYRTWSRMKVRCYNKKSDHYHCYGGRGISVCDEWMNNFQEFWNWAIANGWEKGLSIDRINVNGNYEPSNCRWVNQKQQCRNKRDNIVVKIEDEEKTLIDWCEELDVDYKIVTKRIYRGISPEKAIKMGTNRGYIPYYERKRLKI